MKIQAENSLPLSNQNQSVAAFRYAVYIGDRKEFDRPVQFPPIGQRIVSPDLRAFREQISDHFESDRAPQRAGARFVSNSEHTNAKSDQGFVVVDQALLDGRGARAVDGHDCIRQEGVALISVNLRVDRYGGMPLSL